MVDLGVAAMGLVTGWLAIQAIGALGTPDPWRDGRICVFLALLIGGVGSLSFWHGQARGLLVAAAGLLVGIAARSIVWSMIAAGLRSSGK